jgi:hypothetical protein
MVLELRIVGTSGTVGTGHSLDLASPPPRVPGPRRLPVPIDRDFKPEQPQLAAFQEEAIEAGSGHPDQAAELPT